MAFQGNCQDSWECHGSRGRFSTTIARMLGDALGLLHRQTREQRKLADDGHRFSDQPPWVLSVHRADLGLFLRVSNANIQAIKIIQAFPEFCERLDTLRQGWMVETLIHHDLKWDNCIVSAKSGLQRKVRLMIVDWELANRGDPCWDVGSVFND